MSAAQASKSTRSAAREQLIAAAEHLFAESGIDAVSLRQINVAAGQKNSSAAHYHFGTKEALILSIYQVRMEHVNKRRMLMLEHIEQTGQQKNIRTLVEVIGNEGPDKCRRHGCTRKSQGHHKAHEKACGQREAKSRRE